MMLRNRPVNQVFLTHFKEVDHESKRRRARSSVHERNRRENLDSTLPVSSGFEVIVEAEAGSAIHSSGAQFLTNILVRDLSANDLIPATPTQASSGAMSSSAWPELYRAFQYKVNTANLTGRENHVCQVISFLNAGMTNPDVSFAVSPLFIMTK